MAATYNYGNNPIIDYPRLLIPDTNMVTPIFQDSEILAAYNILSLSAFQSGMFYSGAAGAYLPPNPTNYLRCAALLIRSIAGNTARLLLLQQLLDVKLQDPAKAVAALNDVADKYMEMDDNSGAFFIAEQVNTGWAFIDRYWQQVQRQSGGGYIG